MREDARTEPVCLRPHFFHLSEVPGGGTTTLVVGPNRQLESDFVSLSGTTVNCVGRLTVRAVAGEAGVSHTLVLFHFGRKATLVHELLDWVLDSTSVLNISEDIARFPHARDRSHALLEQEVTRQSHQPEYTRLFLEYWALGAHHEEIRTRISAELERYREAFRTIMEVLIEADPCCSPGRRRMAWRRWR